MRRVVASTIFALVIVTLVTSTFASPPDRWEHGVLKILDSGSKLVEWFGPATSYIGVRWNSKEAIDSFLTSLNSGQPVERQAGKEGIAVAALNVLGTEGWQLVSYNFVDKAGIVGREQQWTWYVKRRIDKSNTAPKK